MLSVEFEELFGAMKCPHCSIMFHDAWNSIPIPLSGRASDAWAVKATVCPNCREPVVRLGIITGYVKDAAGRTLEWTISDSNSVLAYPKFPRRYPVSDAIPSNFRADYLEACDVLEISAKASAALSRRVLQGILSDKGYPGRDLAKQIDSVLNESDPSKALPTGVRETVDVVRNFGNFAAHLMKNRNRLQEVIDVEEHEAQWCLEIVEALFDHYYVRPSETAKRMAALNKKLNDAGKPPAKS